MFLLGLFIGFIAPYVYKALTTVYKADAVLKTLTHTSFAANLKFMGKCAALQIEQALTQSLKYDAVKKRHVVSFYIKGALHQLYIKPAMGPSKMRETDPVKRGYAILDTDPLVEPIERAHLINEQI